jgi:hypothetical protein
MGSFQSSPAPAKRAVTDSTADFSKKPRIVLNDSEYGKY